MTRVARVAAQAKINLFLHVGSVYDGRYHMLSTWFQRIDLADVVTVRVRDQREDTLRVTGPALPAAGLGPDDQNLAMRAAVAFRDRTGWPRGVSIEIEKHIPVGGGLGGGSADAGAVLRALNALAPAPLDAEALLWMALGLGSDVPFLASGMVRALGLGRGENLSELPAPFPPAAVVLVIPPFGVATADAFRWLDERGTRSHLSLEPPSPFGAKDPWSRLDIGNDFEPVVEARHPFIATARARLRDAGASLARMSGSGSTVFGVFPGTPPPASALGLDATILHTRASDSVVAVEVLE